MSALVLHTLTVHAAARNAAAALRPHRAVSTGVPDPPAAPPPGVGNRVNTILGWWKWGALICGVVGLGLCSMKMMVGHRNRSNLAADGASGIVWVLGGLSLLAMSPALVGFFL